mgnify:CR=1 FL=1
MSAEYTDAFEIVNGPEDGVAFPIIRSPFTIGASADCAVYLNFDKKVFPEHARVNVVSNGYRVRSISGNPIYINEKRSGLVWARIARSGDLIRIGETSLCVVCAPDGLAKRSLGMPTESNLVWLVRSLFGKIIKVSGLLYRMFFRMLSRFNRVAFVVVVAVLLLAWLQPQLLRYVIHFLRGWAFFLWGYITGG